VLRTLAVVLHYFSRVRLVLGVAGRSAAAANGTGTMTAKTTSVTYGSTGHVLTFTYTAATVACRMASSHVPRLVGSVNDG